MISNKQASVLLLLANNKNIDRAWSDHVKKISIFGILAGLISLMIVDSMGGEFFLTLLFDGNPESPSIQQMYATSTVFLILRTIVGVISLTAGGYVTTRIAKSTSYINATILGLISLGLTILAYNDSYPAWFNIIGFLFLIPAALYGAHMATKQLAEIETA